MEMDYGAFKGLLGLLFFGAVFVFGFWQLAALRRDRHGDRDGEG